jgi:transposase
MDSEQLYSQLLGISAPWKVERVDMDVHALRVDVYLAEAAQTKFCCPHCAQELGLYDHTPPRQWRHLDSCQFQTVLHARIPRIKCKQHGVMQVELPWAEPGCRFTRLFEALAIDVLLSTDLKKAATLLCITWDQAWGVMQRAVLRGRRAKAHKIPAYIGVDEKAIAKGQKYMTLVYDLRGGTVEYVGDERRQESLDAYFRAFEPPMREAIKAVAMDMWQPYINSCRDHVPGAENKIVFDRFHIMAHVSAALDKVRRREHKELVKQGDSTLSKSKYLWLRSYENVPQKSRQHFEQLRAAELKTARAWAMKEALRGLWEYSSQGWALRFWKHWYYWATHSKLQPIIDAAKMIARHLPNVLTYLTHRITNAMAEGINSQIAKLQKRACGYRNSTNFKVAIYFHCGGLDLWPRRLTHSKV